MPIILASASPRRAGLLRNADIAFTVEPAHVPEQPLPDEVPLQYAQRLAREKALAVFSRHPDSVVLGADTIVVADEHLLEKPLDHADAARMLRLLSGRSHQVITGVCLVAPEFEEIAAEITDVRFGTLSDDEIASYIATGEPMDKAGAYAIQGIASRWVERIDGCYFNVVGLPLPLVYRMLRELERAKSIFAL
ncbi:MAG TPA: Maf family protein [Candidatus Binatia bacterium]|nr:Maf family protein [Candidatus Binatia bacterium]